MMTEGDTRSLSVAELLAAATREMWNSFEKTVQLAHPGEKGRAREDALRDFLKRYLPGRFGVESGFVIDAAGETSKQIDVVIFDIANAPVFKISESVQVFPIESVAGVVQVKSRLDARELDSAIDNLNSVIKLNRLAGKQYLATAGGVMIPTIVTEEHKKEFESGARMEPVLAAIFAFSGTSLHEIAGRLADRNRELDVHDRIPLVCVLDQGIISYVSETEISPYNAYFPDAKLAHTTEAEKAVTLHLFYGMLAYGVTRKYPIALSYKAYAGIQPFNLTFVD